MADPLSVSASIAGLIQFADSAFRRSYKFVQHCKNAPKKSRNLLEEVKSLACVLHGVRLIAD